jgi:SAM-dependent methyltransferase
MKKTLRSFIPNKFRVKYREYKKKRIIKTYAGNDVTCNICHSNYSAFGAYGLEKRRNARCHNCGSLERHRLVWKYIEDKELLKKPLSILHFAPEKVLYDIFSSSPGIQYYPCDLFPENYKNTGRIKITKVDITDIPFDSNQFDFILCNHVLEHVPDDHLAMSELFRVMKNDGFGIFQVPIDYNREHTYEDFSITTPEGRIKAFGQHDHVRWYGRDYKNRLAKVGFKVLEDDYVTTFSKNEQVRYGFMSSEMIYFCKKPIANND